MKLFLILLLAISFNSGCAKMQVGGTKEPIKVDISMRLDVYQHVEKDIDAIESIVSGSAEDKKAADKQSFLGAFLSQAYAQENLSPEVEQAALRRKDRLAELSSWQAQGVIGENKDALVENRNPQGLDAAVKQTVEAENADRMIIYQAIAKKNNTSLEEVQRLYAQRLQSAAPAGTPIESADGAWQVK